MGRLPKLTTRERAALYASKSKCVTRVKRRLDFPPGKKLPRCPCKSQAKINKLEEKGDYSHADPKHDPCPLCRCPAVAGNGTYGWFWGTREEDWRWWYFGHYGAGPCYRHDYYPGEGRCNYFPLRIVRARKYVEAYSSYAWAKQQMTDHEIVAQSESHLIQRNQQRRENIQMLQDCLQQAHSVLKSREGKNAEIVCALEQLTETVRNKRAKFTKAQFARLEDALDDRIFRESRFTEKAGGRVIEMTDETANKQLVLLANAVSKLNLDDVRIRAEDLVNVEEITKRIPVLLDLCKNTLRKVHERWLNYDQEEESIPEVLNEIFEEQKNALNVILRAMTGKSA